MIVSHVGSHRARRSDAPPTAQSEKASKWPRGLTQPRRVERRRWPRDPPAEEGTTTALPVLKPLAFSTRSLAPASQFSAWQAHMSPILDVSLPEGVAESDAFAADQHRLEPRQHAGRCSKERAGLMASNARPPCCGPSADRPLACRHHAKRAKLDGSRWSRRRKQGPEKFSSGYAGKSLQAAG